jgi:outer membrane protein assembly factor BamB
VSARRRLAGGAAALAAVLALGLTACSGGDDASAETASPSTDAGPASAVRVEVTNGDTDAPIEGATVTATGAGGVSATTSVDGIAVLDGSARAVRVKAPGLGTRLARVRDGSATVELYDPALQSPQYGGDVARTRYVPAVEVPPPDGPPAWEFDGRVLIEFPPAVDDGLVVFGTNSGRVFALDADTGDLRWARRVKGEIASSPAIVGDTVLVAGMGGTLTAYARAGGEVLWTYSTAGSPIESSPLVVDGLAYIGDWNGVLHAVDVEDGTAAWTYQASADIKGSAALAGDTVVVGDYAGVVHALDAESGAVRWTSSAGQRFYGGPGVSGGTVVIGDVGGAVIALSAADGSVRWRHSAGGYVYSSPAIAGGRVFIGSYSGAFQALDLGTGAVIWTHDAGGRISGSATVVDGVVYTSILYAPGQDRKTWGLDVDTGAVRYEGDDGRYSPAVGAGDTLYLVGTRMLYAYPAPPRGRT